MIYLLRKMTPMSYPEIAIKLGKNNHSGVITSAQRFEQLLKVDEPVSVPGRDEPVTPSQLVHELKRLATA